MITPILYAHRGNTHGPDPTQENNPDYARQAIAKGFHVEVDLWKIDGKLFLGHDKPQYEISELWLFEREHQFLVHIKNYEALDFVRYTGLHFFCHKNDPFTLTSNYSTWVHDMTLPAKIGCIVPLITLDQIHAFLATNQKVSGICSDYVACLPKLYEGR